MKILYFFASLLILTISGSYNDNLPVIRDISYCNIEQSSVTVTWKTDYPSDSKIRYMISDSNYQPLTYTDSVYSNIYDTIHSMTINYVNPNTIYNFNITSSNQTGSVTSGNNMFATKSVTSGTIRVYFNHDVDTTVNSGIKAEGNVNLTTKLLHRIESSGYNIDIAVSSFDDAGELTTSLLKAKRDGIGIRFIYDSRAHSRWVDTLIHNGIPVLKRNFDTPPGHTMNNNFWIFDARCDCSGDAIYVFTSSAKITDSSLYIDKNNAIDIQDRTLAYIYTREFDEMWGSHGDNPDTSRARFGSRKLDNIPHLVNLNGIYAEVYFAPSDSAERMIRKTIVSANNGLMFCSYDFRSGNILNSFYENRTGKHIRGIFDRSNATSGVYSGMKSWADVWIDSTNGKNSHKYLIIDPLQMNQNTKLLTGSYNWTTESNLYNDENILIINSPVTANLYYQEFHQRYKEATGHPVNVRNLSNEIPSNPELWQNYPNPFNSMTNIKWQTVNAGAVKIVIFDITGKEITTLVNEYMKPGTYELRYNAENLPSGVYFYSMTAGNLRQTKKLLLIK